MYYILNLTTNEPYSSENGERIIYGDGNEANVIARTLTKVWGAKYIPQKVATVDWEAREQARIDSGDYIIPDWSISRIFEDYGYKIDPKHYLHVSKKDPLKVAFTQSPDKGIADLQTTMRVGAYLMQYVEGMSESNAAYFSNVHGALYSPIEVLFAKTAREIIDVYQNGPSSCMSKSLDYYLGHCHPVSVFGDSDLALAYIKNGDDITARGLVWSGKQVFCRLYGDGIRLRKGLLALGYDEDTNWTGFEGARIKKIENENGNGFILPYLDGISSVIDDGDCLIISRYGEIKADSTSGVSFSGISCDSCDDLTNEDEIGEVYVGRDRTENWCEYCRSNEAFYCHGIGEIVSNARAYEVDGYVYADWYVRENANRCEYSGQYTFEGLNEVIVDARGTKENWSHAHAIDDFAFICRISGDLYHVDLMVYDDWTSEPRAITVSPNDLPLDEPFCALVLKIAA